MYDHALKFNPNDAETYFNKGLRYLFLKAIFSINRKNMMRLSKCMRDLIK